MSYNSDRPHKGKAHNKVEKRMSDMLASTTTTTTPNLPWVEPFLAQLRASATVDQAAITAGVTRSWAYICRTKNPTFRDAWAAAIAEAPARRPDWRPIFLDHLQQGRTIVEACKQAGITHRTAYRAHRLDAEFAAAWDALRSSERLN